MLKKTGKTPKSYAKNLENNEGTLFVCDECDRVIRESVKSDGKCPFCGSTKLSKCELKSLKTSNLADAKSTDQHT